MSCTCICTPVEYYFFQSCCGEVWTKWNFQILAFREEAIIWTSDYVMVFGPLTTNFCENSKRNTTIFIREKGSRLRSLLLVPYMRLLCSFVSYINLDRIYQNTVLSKVQNRGSPNGPPMVDGWVVRITFGWSVYAMDRNDDKTLIWLLCRLFSTITRACILRSR